MRKIRVIFLCYQEEGISDAHSRSSEVSSPAATPQPFHRRRRFLIDVSPTGLEGHLSPDGGSYYNTKEENRRTLNEQRVVAPFLRRDKEATPRNTECKSKVKVSVSGKSKDSCSLKRVKEPEGIERYKNNQGLSFSKACQSRQTQSDF